ncbi:hypothetical protein E8E13_007236 [Curvularia kusanoi]|uniref:Mnd1 HTH domain-containing protein n=1 Tax=Curvularia kusanoi TaxID=90978 RepID=A0A9P4THC7_CURKU|nr:hypothetical protein E8E13_007236 [Curvularia kusanoi]
MPPKTNVNAQKQEMILAWFRKTGLAYSIKDLEKLLPSVASINGMAVKEYIQALLGDDSINTEKISNVGWYWSFSSQTKREREKVLAKAQELHDKASAASAELQKKVDQAGAARAEDEGLLAGTGGDRKALVIKHDELHHHVEKLRLELATYSEHDPVELSRKTEETRRLRAAVEQSTEHIYCMEGWLKERVLDRESQVCFLKECYGEEWDDEDGGLREL